MRALALLLVVFGCEKSTDYPVGTSEPTTITSSSKQELWASLQEERNKELYPEGKGKLPADAEVRALLFLKPHPQGYVGHLPEDFDFEKFEYDSHECHDHPNQKDSLICTACYKHPSMYLGRLSMACPKKAGESCSILVFSHEDLHRWYGVAPAACEKSDGDR